MASGPSSALPSGTLVGHCVASGPSSALPNGTLVGLCVASGPSSAQPRPAELHSGRALCGLRAQPSLGGAVGLCVAFGPSSAQLCPAAPRQGFVWPPGPAQLRVRLRVASGPSSAQSSRPGRGAIGHGASVGLCVAPGPSSAQPCQAKIGPLGAVGLCGALRGASGPSPAQLAQQQSVPGEMGLGVQHAPTPPSRSNPPMGTVWLEWGSATPPLHPSGWAVSPWGIFGVPWVPPRHSPAQPSSSPSKDLCAQGPTT